MGNLAAPSVVQAAWSLLARFYAASGALAACGPLTTNPDTDLLVLSACSKVGGRAGRRGVGMDARPSTCLLLLQLRLAVGTRSDQSSWCMKQRSPPPPPPNGRELTRCPSHTHGLLQLDAPDPTLALLFFARYTCAAACGAGAPPSDCTYGVKLLGSAVGVPGSDPRAGQVDAVDEPPSVALASSAGTGRRRLQAAAGGPASECITRGAWCHS